MTKPEAALAIRDAILSDVTRRVGWRHEWDQFSPEVQKNIRLEWLELILPILDRFSPA